jgi:hypothetical protein
VFGRLSEREKPAPRKYVSRIRSGTRAMSGWRHQPATIADRGAADTWVDPPSCRLVPGG